MTIKNILNKFKDWRFSTYAMQSIDGMAGGLVGIFIPIYFLSIGYSVSQIFIFFIINNFSILVFFFVASWFAKNLGLVKTLFARLVFLALNLFLLYNLKAWPSFFYLISVLSAIELAFYWFPLHVVFAKSAESETMGEQVSKLFALPSLVGIVIPLIGAGISTLFGFKALFIVAGIIYLISIVPFLFVGHIPIEVKINFSRIIDYAHRYKKYFVAEFFLGISSEVEAYILPIFLFLTFSNILSIGFLATFLGLGSAIFTLLVGKYSSRIEKKKFLRTGAVVMIVIWVGRYFSIDQVLFYILSILAGVLNALISVPFNSIFYINAKNNHVEDFIIFREIPISLGRIMLYSIGLLFVSQIKISFLISVIPYVFLLFF
jgi:MFS family permease